MDFFGLICIINFYYKCTTRTTGVLPFKQDVWIELFKFYKIIKWFSEIMLNFSETCQLIREIFEQNIRSVFLGSILAFPAAPGACPEAAH